MSLRNLFKALSLVCLVLVWVGAARAEENPAQSGAVKQAIKEYVEQDTALKGAFLIKDPKSSAVRELDFDHIHDSVHETQPGAYYACVDFKEGEKILDLDFYLKETSAGRFEVSDIVIHKVDGKDVTKE